MEITLNKWSALHVMRSMRVDPVRARALRSRTDIAAPDPSPAQRWRGRVFSDGPLGELGLPPTQKVYVAVPEKGMRIQSRRVVNTVYGEGIPAGSFVGIGNGIAISSPELLFVEMASSMRPIEHLMLGHELCGSFGRDAQDPRNGNVAYGLSPLTSVARIGRFLENARGITGIARARESLARLNDDAWAPTESVIASFLRCPIDDMGFGFSSLELNERVFREQLMPDSKESRVPDILVGGTLVGANYDGLVHLDLDSIARAAFEMGMNPTQRHVEDDLHRAMERVREKALDDIRRNRELAVAGYTVFPVLKEDLYQPGGLDQLVARMVGVIERQTSLDVRLPKRALSSKALCEDRYRLLRSLLPGNYEPDKELGRYIAGCRISGEAPSIVEYHIEL